MSLHSQAKLGDDSFAAPRGKTILVVDDYSSFCAVVAAMLRPCGYHVLVASSGEEASAIAAREDETIDLLLTDIEMPQMCGDELADSFRAQKPMTPVLFMSCQARAQNPSSLATFSRSRFTPKS